MKILVTLLILVLVILQYEIWFSRNGLRHYSDLKNSIEKQQSENIRLSAQNQALEQEISNLKQGKEASEEHARNDLNMIKPNETFYEIIKPEPAVKQKN